MWGTFLKKVPHTPQKLFENIFWWHLFLKGARNFFEKFLTNKLT